MARPETRSITRARDAKARAAKRGKKTVRAAVVKGKRARQLPSYLTPLTTTTAAIKRKVASNTTLNVAAKKSKQHVSSHLAAFLIYLSSHP